MPRSKRLALRKLTSDWIMSIDCSMKRCCSPSLLWRGAIVPLCAAILAVTVSANPFASSTQHGSSADKLDRALNDRLAAGRPEEDVRVIVQSSGDREAVKWRGENPRGRPLSDHPPILGLNPTPAPPHV